MQNKALDTVTLGDLEQLVTDRIHESKRIEYKGAFYRLDDPKDRDEQRKEMLKDISAFANTLGGDLIIGMKAKDGVPIKVNGFPEANPDGLKLKISELVQQWIEPRISINIESVKISPGQVVLLIRVNQSLVSPHRVIFANIQGEFYARNATGVYSMDTGELRRAFTKSHSAYERIKQFRYGRVDSLADHNRPKIICHLIPLDAFASTLSLTPKQLHDQGVNLPPFTFPRGWNTKYNIDGVISSDGTDFGHTQAYRNGIIEVAVAGGWTNQSVPILSLDFVGRLVFSFSSYLKFYRELRIPAPVWVFVTVTGVEGKYIPHDGLERDAVPIDRDTLYLPEVEITDFSVDPKDLLRPALDALWNAGGYAYCLMYDAQGNFRG